MIYTVTPNPVVDRTLTVPKIVMNAMSRAVEIREDWGGKGFNVSRALLSLGGESEAIGFLGGAAGEKLAQGLRAEGIRLTAVPIAQETRTNIVITEPDGGDYVKVNEAGPTIKGAELALFHKTVEKSVENGDIWALCGSLPPGIPEDFYGQLTERLHAAGARVLLDAGGEAFRQAIPACPDIVKPNDIEASAFLGVPVDGRETAPAAVDKFMGLGITCVALSLGADGLVLGGGGERFWARPPQVKARNPVGAGDALVAGLLWALSQGCSLADAARWGVASGTAAAMREGVTAGTRAEVETVYARVTVDVLSEGA